jgi:hypothetical protein
MASSSGDRPTRLACPQRAVLCLQAPRTGNAQGRRAVHLRAREVREIEGHPRPRCRRRLMMGDDGGRKLWRVRERKMVLRERHGAREEHVVVLEPVYGHSRADSRGQNRERVTLARVRLASRPSARPRSMKPVFHAAAASCPLIGRRHRTCVFTYNAHEEVLRAGERFAENERARSPRRPSSRRGRATSSPRRLRDALVKRRRTASERAG